MYLLLIIKFKNLFDGIETFSCRSNQIPIGMTLEQYISEKAEYVCKEIVSIEKCAPTPFCY